MSFNTLASAFKPVLREKAQQQQNVAFQDGFEKAVRLRGIRAKHNFLSEERLSAEPRGNEVDLRRGKR